MYLICGYHTQHVFSATLRNTPRVVIGNLVMFRTSKGDESVQNISLNKLNTTVLMAITGSK